MCDNIEKPISASSCYLSRVEVQQLQPSPIIRLKCVPQHSYHSHFIVAQAVASAKFVKRVVREGRAQHASLHQQESHQEIVCDREVVRKVLLEKLRGRSCKSGIRKVCLWE